MQREKGRIVRVRSVFLYDIDGIFKSIPLSRFRSLFSNSLEKKEKFDFFVSGRFPERIRKLLSEQRTLKLKFKENCWGLRIYAVLEEGEIPCSDYVSLPLRKYVPLLFLVRTFDDVKAILFTDDGVFGDKDYVKPFV